MQFSIFWASARRGFGHWLFKTAPPPHTKRVWMSLPASIAEAASLYRLKLQTISSAMAATTPNFSPASCNRCVGRVTTQSKPVRRMTRVERPPIFANIDTKPATFLAGWRGTDHCRKLAEILLLHSITVASPHRIATFELCHVLPSPCLIFFVRRPHLAGFGGFAGFCKKLHTWKT